MEQIMEDGVSAARSCGLLRKASSAHLFASNMDFEIPEFFVVSYGLDKKIAQAK